MSKTLPSGWFDGSSLVSTPVASEHGDRCACRHCTSQGYRELQETADYQRHEITRLRDELAKTQKQAAVEKYKRLTLEIAEAVRVGDRDSWAKAVGERLGLGVAVMQEVEGL